MSLAEYRVHDGVDVSLVSPFAERLLALLESFAGRVLIISGRRSYSEQVVLWNIYVAGGNLAARPGTSNHERGLAADLRIVDDSVTWPDVHAKATTVGLRFPISGEDWHVESDPNWTPTEDPDMTPQQFAAAIGATIPTEGPFAGMVCVPLINDPAYPGQPVEEWGTTLYPFASALAFAHQELKMKRING